MASECASSHVPESLSTTIGDVAAIRSVSPTIATQSRDPEAPSSVSPATATREAKKRKAGNRAGPYKECDVSARQQLGTKNLNDLSTAEHMSAAWQPRVKIRRCSVASAIAEESKPAVSCASAEDGVKNLDTLLPNTPASLLIDSKKTKPPPRKGKRKNKSQNRRASIGKRQRQEVVSDGFTQAGSENSCSIEAVGDVTSHTSTQPAVQPAPLDGDLR